MKDYVTVLLAVVFIALGFIIQKAYINCTEGSAERTVEFNVYTGICCTVLFLAASGFTVSFTRFSMLYAVLKTACSIMYTIIGFRIMKSDSVALYMLFLMSGGMLLPSVWGWLFLAEKPKLLHILGICVILISMILNGVGKDRPPARVLAMCCAVFFLNGFVSVFSKLHQIEKALPTVSTVDFSIMCSALSAVMCSVLRAVLALKRREDPQMRQQQKINALPIVLIVVFSAVSTASSFLLLEGAKTVPASMLYPVTTGGTIALSGIFAFLFFKERLSKRGVLSLVLCCLGTCMFV